MRALWIAGKPPPTAKRAWFWSRSGFARGWVGSLLAFGLTLAWSSSAGGVSVRGAVKLSPSPAPSTQQLITKLAMLPPSEAAPPPQPAAVFLEVVSKAGVPKDAGPPPEVHFKGLRFVPAVNSCVAITGKLRLVNDGPSPLTVKVGDQTVGPIPPGEGKVFGCGDESGSLKMTVDAWPHVGGVVHVKSVGIPGRVDADGKFSLEAQKAGNYKLWVLGLDGPILSQDVEVGRKPVRLGTLRDPKLPAKSDR